MIILFILGLLLGAASVVFALQNVATVTVTLFSYQITGSLALVLLLALCVGALVIVLLLLPEFIGNYFRFKNLQKENMRLTDDLRKQKELTVFAKHTPPTSEEIAKIENGVSEEKP